MAFVLDCSVTTAWVFRDEAGTETDALRKSLLEDHAMVPALWALEVANILWAANRRCRIEQADWATIPQDLAALPIDIGPTSFEIALGSALPLARAAGVAVLCNSRSLTD